jgi:hypothetical protein
MSILLTNLEIVPVCRVIEHFGRDLMVGLKNIFGCNNEYTRVPLEQCNGTGFLPDAGFIWNRVSVRVTAYAHL